MKPTVRPRSTHKTSYFNVFSEPNVGDLKQGFEDIVDSINDANVTHLLDDLEGGPGQLVSLSTIALSKVLVFGSEHQVTQQIVAEELLELLAAGEPFVKNRTAAFENLGASNFFMQDDMDSFMEINNRTTALREKLSDFLNSVTNVADITSRENFVKEFRYGENRFCCFCWHVDSLFLTIIYFELSFQEFMSRL